MRLSGLKSGVLAVLSAFLLAGCSNSDLVIVDSGGQPIEGAKVVGASLSMWGQTLGQTSFSDKKGRARIPNGAQPTKWVSIYKDGFTPVENIDVSQPKPIPVKMQAKNK
jgi:hypothetical protein